MPILSSKISICTGFTTVFSCCQFRLELFLTELTCFNHNLYYTTISSYIQCLSNYVDKGRILYGTYFSSFQRYVDACVLQLRNCNANPLNSVEPLNSCLTIKGNTEPSSELWAREGAETIMGISLRDNGIVRTL